jgi:hypothetical protein
VKLDSAVGSPDGGSNADFGLPFSPSLVKVDSKLGAGSDGGMVSHADFVSPPPPPPPPPPDNPLSDAIKTLVNDLTKLGSGVSQQQIEQDAKYLADLAKQHGNETLEKVALLMGSSVVNGSYSRNLGADSVMLLVADGVFGPAGFAGIFDDAPPQFDPLKNDPSPLDKAYLQLEVDIENGADQSTIQADASKVETLAGEAGNGALSATAYDIVRSYTLNDYDPNKSLTALMNANPWSSSTTSSSGGSSPPPPPPTLPSESDAYNQLVTDIKSNADSATIIKDAGQLAIVAQQNGDINLSYLARNVGDAAGEGVGTADLDLADLTNAAPGSQAAKDTPQGPFSQPDDLGSAYLKLENDVVNNADPQTLRGDAEQVYVLAKQEGNGALADVADNIFRSLLPQLNDYSQLGSEIALMTHGASGQDLGTVPPDENDAYQKLLSDISSNADQGTLTNDAVALARGAIAKGDFGLAQTALDIGDDIKGGTYDANKATTALNGVAPGTQAAKEPPVSDPLSTSA